MAEVFEAELVGDLGFVRKVALKRMLEAAAADPGAAKRFLDEAVIASRLHHANVISVVDLGTLDDRPFQVLEFVDGIDAHRMLQRAGGKLPIAVALAIANGVAHALDHAHTAVDAAGLPLGIVHRDVKPSNVLVSRGGDVKLGDFGIAVARDRSASTEAGVVAGTLGFIAPEQRARTPLDGRTDVFALGLTLHALLAGTSPLADISVEMEVLAGAPVPIDPRIPDDIRDILARVLANRRDDRPFAGELAALLGAALANLHAGDARTALRDFVAMFDAKPAAAGALDMLLGIEIVMTGEGEVRHFETRATTPRELPPEPQREPTRPTTAEPLRAPRPTTPEPLREPTRPTPERGPTNVDAVTVASDTPSRRRVLPIIAAIAGLAIIGAIGGWRLTRTSSPPIDAAVAIAETSVESRDAEPTRVVAVDAAIHDDATPVVDRDAAAGLMFRDAAPIVRISPADARTVAVDAAVSVDAAPVGTGYIQVLGEDLIGAAVLVDGKHAGSVPNPIAVTLGQHSIEVEKRDGTRLPARRVEVTQMHNRANPLRPTW